MSCQEWLRKCIYERSSSKNKSQSQLFTFMISAFWHGFYGGYYLSFVFWFAQLFLSQQVFSETKKDSNYVKMYRKTGIIGRSLLWSLSNYLFTVNGVFFQVLSLGQSINIMVASYFIPQLMVIIPIMFFMMFGTRSRRIKKETKESSSDTDKYD